MKEKKLRARMNRIRGGLSIIEKEINLIHADNAEAQLSPNPTNPDLKKCLICNLISEDNRAILRESNA